MKPAILFFPRFGPDSLEEPSLLMPLSMVYVATPLRAAGREVSILDARIVDDWRGELRRQVERLDPVCVGISSLTGSQLMGAIEAAKLLKQLSPDLPLVWGGVHASLLPLQTIREDFVDIVVMGEGEATFPELVQHLEQGKDLAPVRGIWYKDGGVPRRTADRPRIDLNGMPPLAYDLLDMPRYYRPFWDEKPTGPTFITSRGCPWACSYCYIEVFEERRWRPLRPEKVRENLEHLLSLTNTRSVFCLDDSFFVDIRRVKEICRQIINYGMNIEPDNVNCRADSISRFDREALDLLEEAGVRRLFVGLESGSNRMLKLIRKDSTRHRSPQRSGGGIRPTAASAHSMARAVDRML